MYNCRRLAAEVLSHDKSIEYEIPIKGMYRRQSGVEPREIVYFASCLRLVFVRGCRCLLVQRQRLCMLRSVSTNKEWLSRYQALALDEAHTVAISKKTA